VLLYAGAHRTTIEQGCAALEAAPHPNTVRNAAAAVEVAELEDQLNQALAQSLPKRWGKQPLEVAVDLKLIPYYGDPHEGEEEFIAHGQPKQGTTTFFGYASLYVIKKNRRYTLALVAVRQGEGMRGVLRRLWSYWGQLGLGLRCLYLDREFYSVAVLRWLLEKDLPFVMAAPKKGKRGGINGLIAQKGPGVWPYTVRSPKAGSVTVQVAVVGKYLNGRRGKHGRQCYAFVIHRFPFATSALWKKYRTRFGIESSHRVWEQARARTASRRAGLRLLLLGIAVLLHNLWVWLKWTALSWPRRGPGGRVIWDKGLPFRRLLLFLARAIETRLGAVATLFLPVCPA
jgi:putative transposase